MPCPLCPRLVFPLALVALVAACRRPADTLFAFSSDAPSRAGLVPLEAEARRAWPRAISGRVLSWGLQPPKR